MSLTFQQHRHVNNDIEHHAIFKAMQDTHCYFQNNAFKSIAGGTNISVDTIQRSLNAMSEAFLFFY